MTIKEDQEFLALLAHRGHLPMEVAGGLFEAVRRGEELDGLLESEVGWSAAAIQRLRRTRGGEIPEIPGYEILGLAGTGGTADVFRAREVKTERLMALKVLKPAASRHEPTRKAFIAEARLLERLRHPGLVEGWGVARSGETFFSRMEFIDGHTLLELLDRGQVFDETQALRVVLEMAEVLAYLSEQKVVHRDVKPGNIMLASSGNLKLIDLGFAGHPPEPARKERLASLESTVGTPQYLAPEQAQGSTAVDLRSDIYSLGVTLFHLVVHRLPFESSDDREVLRMQVMQSLSSPELKGRGLSHHLHYFIEKMMAKDPGLRYQSWSELIGDVRGQIEGRDHLDFEKNARTRSAKSTLHSRRRSES
jgi:eukaryotic-like serine/threonine-protein kinase